MASSDETFKAFEVPYDDNRPSSNLQDAFKKYRSKKQEQLCAKKHQLGGNSPEKMKALRSQFLQTAMSYIGTPYARRYHQPDSPTYSAALFLDCCGLIRRVLRDLEKEFCFSIGPWNQAYMCDTLPIVYSGPSEMQPGDLVFISGTYNNTKAKKQHHDIVHVEIWIGEGEKTLGARWQKGRVEVHDDYKFSAKSYHSMQYHFKSIDTWLSGECKSHCPEHLWQVHQFNPGKYSIFGLEGEGEAAYSQTDGAGDHEGCIASSAQLLQQECGVLLSDQVTTKPAQPLEQAGLGLPREGSGHVSPAHTESLKQTGEILNGNKQLAGKKPRAQNFGRLFVICGGNAGPLVEKYLMHKGGWQKSSDKQTYTLKWVELKHHIDYKCFREGEQIVNHFPNINLLTTKIGLLESLRSYCRLHKPRTGMDSFFPQTFRIDLASEYAAFLQIYDDKDLWICKPTGANQGKGIFLVRELKPFLARLEDDKKACKYGAARIIQRYISNPLLIHGRKFDLRVYMLVVWGRKWLVFYREGYARLCCEEYQLGSHNLSVHLTNQYQQRKNPLYSEVKEDTVWDFPKLQEYISKEYRLSDEWVHTILTQKMKSIMTTCFKSIKHKLSKAVGFFDLLGFDFMLDSNFTVWLIEVNINPGLHTNCEALGRISPSVVNETLDIAIDIFDKCRKNKTLDLSHSLGNFTPLHV